jgi:RNA polymerase sigma-70 factor, ECF subfamily
MYEPLYTDRCVALLTAGLHAQDPDVLPCMFRFARSMKMQLQRRFKSYLSSEDLDDVITDAIVRVFLKGAKFDPSKAQLSTWLYRHALYNAFALIRSRLNAIPLDSVVGITDSRRGYIEQISETPIHLSPLVASLLRRLPEPQANVIRLYYLENWPVEEIADLYGYKVSAIYSILCRARKKLREFAEGSAD